jgi:hypothetical protein
LIFQNDIDGAEQKLDQRHVMVTIRAENLYSGSPKGLMLTGFAQLLRTGLAFCWLMNEELPHPGRVGFENVMLHTSAIGGAG